MPLHFAVKRHAPPEAVQLLLEAYPPGAAAVDDSGDTPLHVLADSSGEIQVTSARRWAREAAAVVARLLGADADGARRRGATGHTPLELALQHNGIHRGTTRLSAHALATLVAADMPLTRDGAPVEGHAHSWARLLLASGGVVAEAMPTDEQIIWQASATAAMQASATAAIGKRGGPPPPLPLSAVAAEAARLVLDEHGFDRQAALLQRLAPSLKRAARRPAGAGASEGVGAPGRLSTMPTTTTALLLFLGGSGLAVAVAWQAFGGAIIETVAAPAVAAVPLHVGGLVAAIVATLGALVAAGWAMSTVHEIANR